MPMQKRPFLDETAEGLNEEQQAARQGGGTHSPGSAVRTEGANSYWYNGYHYNSADAAYAV